MKQISILLTILILSTSALFAQATDVVDASQPYGLAFKGNDLYIAEFSAHKITKIDITESIPTKVDVVTGLNGPFGIAFNGDELFIAERLSDKISKINITDATPTAVDVITGLDNPSGIEFNGNELYIVERSNLSNGKISKIDINEAIPMTTDVVTGLTVPTDIAFIGNELYIADSNEFKIKKVDITTLSTEDQNFDKTKIQIFPNPSNSYVRISGLNINKLEHKYKIYNIVGNEIKSENISDNDIISIKDLSSGLYFLIFEDGSEIKFIKK